MIRRRGHPCVAPLTDVPCIAIGVTFVVLSALACNASAPAEAGPSVVRIPVMITTEGGDISFLAEVADAPEERQLGLMHRTAMGERESMLFLFPREQQLSFWMRNTLIPLDMIFIKADRTILGVVENAAPKTDVSRRVPGESQFVLEVKGGTCLKLGMKEGQKVGFYAPIPRQ